MLNFMKVFKRTKKEPVRVRCTRVVRNGHGKYIVQYRLFKQRPDGTLSPHWEDVTSRYMFDSITEAFKRASEVDDQAVSWEKGKQRIPLSASDYEDA